MLNASMHRGIAWRPEGGGLQKQAGSQWLKPLKTGSLLVPASVLCRVVHLHPKMTRWIYRGEHTDAQNGELWGNFFILFCTLSLKSLPPSFGKVNWSCPEVRLYWTAPKCLSRNPIGIPNECYLNKSRSSLKSWALSPPPVAIAPLCILCLHFPSLLSLLGTLERAGAGRRMWCSQWLSREQWTNRSINLAGSQALLISCLTWVCQTTLLLLLFQPTWPLPHSGKQYSTTQECITISSRFLGTANDTPWMLEPKKSWLLLSHGTTFWKSSGWLKEGV